MERTLQDLRFGLRLLRKDWGFTWAAVITLALGIGANCAIFSVVNAVLIRPLAFADGDRLVNIWEQDKQAGKGGPSSALDLADFRSRSQSFEQIGAYASRRFNLTGTDEPERVTGARVSAEVFEILRATPLIGRTFDSSETLPGNGQIAVISEGLWRHLLHANSNILDKSIILDGKPYAIVGVMPDSFRFPISGDAVVLWIPIVLNQYEGTLRGYRGFQAIGRLKPGVLRETAKMELASIAGELEQAHPDSNNDISAVVSGLQEDLVKESRPALLALLWAVALVLVVACANIANLFMARAVSREREIGIRSALGAGKKRLIRQLLAEGLLLSLLGGAASLLVAELGIGLLLSVGAHLIPRIQDSAIDGRVLLFTLLLSLLTGLLFGLVSVLQASKASVSDPLKESRAEASAPRLTRARAVLVISEVAISQILLVSAGLLLNSYIRLRDVNPGIEPRNVLTMQVNLAGPAYVPEAQVRRYYHEVLQKISSTRGVQFAGAISHLPLSQSSASVTLSVVDRPKTPDEHQSAGIRLISSNYFRAMGIPSIEGRDFSDADNDRAPKVVIVNQALAHRFFPGEDPLGQRIELTIGDPAPREIVGVVGDVKHSGLGQESGPEAYLPYLQLTFNTMTLVIRTERDPAAFAATARACALAVDDTQPVAQIKTMEQYIAQSIEKPRFSTTLVSLFAVLALVIAAVGVYGVTSYSVNQRKREIGVRMAIGASKAAVLKLIVGQAMAHTLIGVSIGLAGAVASTRILTGDLFGVKGTDPTTFLVVSIVLGTGAFVASYIPAHRATCVDPSVALRYE
jgi:putative ABC transport system permease protein